MTVSVTTKAAMVGNITIPRRKKNVNYSGHPTVSCSCVAQANSRHTITHRIEKSVERVRPSEQQ